MKTKDPKLTLARLASVELGAIEDSPFGKHLPGPLSCYPPMTKGNAPFALSLSRRYFFMELQHGDIEGALLHLRNIAALDRALRPRDESEPTIADALAELKRTLAQSEAAARRLVAAVKGICDVQNQKARIIERSDLPLRGFESCEEV